MIITIEQQLSILGDGINWVKNNLKGERQRNAYDELVAQRIHLKKIKMAVTENPAAVLYGESQQGKSYLVSSLLSTPDSSFSVIDANADKKYDFITQINPIGQGAEATSVVTRFTIKPTSPVAGYPVKIKLLSISDIILMLCDTYYEDVKYYDNLLKEGDIRKSLQEIKQRSEGTCASSKVLISEDDILIMQDYFNRHFRSKAPYILDADYFKTVSLFIETVSIADWVDIFSILWNNNPDVSKLFNNILDQYKSINFASEIYAKYDAILRGQGEILDVTRLKALYEPHQKEIEVCTLVSNNPNQHILHASYLCALSSEVVLQLPQELLAKKSFLQTSDVLDFPGARARLDLKEEQIVDYIPQMLLRGKVAYLFNKYSDNLMINTLLFCHSKRQAGPRFMPELLRTWVESFVGVTPEERSKFMEKAQIAPLFVIGTMFNLDLKKDQNDKDKASLAARWEQRFEKVYKKELFGEDCRWLDAWETGKKFQNCYLLRDFYYSSQAENNIFSGWTREGNPELEEVIPTDYPTFRTDLKETFLQYPFVKNHFANPEEAWTESATINKDGSEYILKHLTIAADNINNAREDKFQRDLVCIQQQIFSELQKYYHDESSDGNLTMAKRLAGEAQASLDIAFGRDPYFFGKMMQCFVLNEGNIYNVFHQEFQNTNLQEKKDFSKYVYVRMKAIGLSPKNTFEENLSILAKAYEMTPEDCQKYFESREFDLNELFAGTDEGMKNISQSLAELLESYLFTDWMRQTQYKALTQLLDAATLDSILEMLQALYKKLGMTQQIAHAIRQYVDKFGTNVDEIQEMIADMCAEILNKFISSVGYSYLSEDAVMALKEANTQKNLGLVFMEDEIKEETISPATIASIFEAMDDLETLKNNLDCERLKYIPGVISRKTWSELLKIGFIQTQDIPNYDVAANHALGNIIQKLNIA